MCSQRMSSIVGELWFVDKWDMLLYLWLWCSAVSVFLSMAGESYRSYGEFDEFPETSPEEIARLRAVSPSPNVVPMSVLGWRYPGRRSWRECEWDDVNWWQQFPDGFGLTGWQFSNDDSTEAWRNQFGGDVWDQHHSDGFDPTGWHCTTEYVSGVSTSQFGRHVQEPYKRYNDVPNDELLRMFQVREVKLRGTSWIRDSHPRISHFARVMSRQEAVPVWSADEVPCEVQPLSHTSIDKIRSAIASFSITELERYYDRLLKYVRGAAGASGFEALRNHLEAPISQCLYSFNEEGDEYKNGGAMQERLNEFSMIWSEVLCQTNVQEDLTGLSLHHALRAFVIVTMENIKVDWSGPAAEMLSEVIVTLSNKLEFNARDNIACRFIISILIEDINRVGSETRDCIKHWAKEILTGVDCVKKYYVHGNANYVVQAALTNPVTRPSGEFAEEFLKSHWSSLIGNGRSPNVVACLLCCCKGSFAMGFIEEHETDDTGVLLRNLTIHAPLVYLLDHWRARGSKKQDRTALDSRGRNSTPGSRQRSTSRTCHISNMMAAEWLYVGPCGDGEHIIRHGRRGTEVVIKTYSPKASGESMVKSWQ